jgi:hypothetical protein
MAILRPLKTYGTRKYVDEVAAAPSNQDPILASEVDADLDTMYTAFNSLVVNATIAATAPAAPVQGQLWWRNDPDGNLYISYNDGNSTQWVPAVPSSAPQWTVSGSALTPTDATKTIVAGTSVAAGIGFQWGTGTVKHRLRDSATVTQILQNSNGATVDDATKSQWLINLNSADAYEIWRSPAGATSVFTNLLKLDNAGALTTNTEAASGAHNIRSTGVGTAGGIFRGTHSRGTIAAPTATQTSDILVQIEGQGYGTALSGGQALLRCVATENWTGTAHGTSWLLYATPVGSLSMSSYLQLQGPGDLVISGSMGQKATGTTWANPSDIRLKKDITPYAHGLADILQLEPISYTLKATDQQTCGFDAEKVRAVFPECVGTTRMKLQPEDEEDTEVLTLDIHPILIALINAVKELAGRS